MATNEKIIAIWGSPHSGKSTFAVKFAENLYERTRAAVVVLFTDQKTPTLPVLFPNHKSQDLFSVGTVLAKTNIFRNDIVSNIVTLKERQNLGFLGYRAGENRFSFPEFKKEKVEEFYTVLSDIADYIIVDCVSSPDENFLSDETMKNAGTLIKVATPDLSSLSFYQSQSPAMISEGYLTDRQISVMNVLSADTTPLITDFASHFKSQVIVPYSPELREQSLIGTVFMPTKDKRYMSAIKTVTEAVRR